MLQPHRPALRQSTAAQTTMRKWFFIIFILSVFIGSTSSLFAQEQFQLQDGQWQKQSAPDPSSPEGQIQTIRKAIAENRPQEALPLVNRWIDAYPNHALLVEAYFLRGDAHVARQDYYQALFDYEVVLRQYPGSELFAQALEREYEIARLFSHGVKRKLLGIPLLTAYGEAEEIFIRIQERTPGSDLGEKASIEIGEHYLRQSEMKNASTAYEMFLTNYPRSTRREYAMLRLIQANLALFKGPVYDATGLIEAAQRLRLFQKEFPVSAEKLGAAAILARLEDSLASKEYQAGLWYETRHKNISAVAVYQRVIRDYPRTRAAEQALGRLSQLGAPVVTPDVSTHDSSPATQPTQSKETGQ